MCSKPIFIIQGYLRKADCCMNCKQMKFLTCLNMLFPATSTVINNSKFYYKNVFPFPKMASISTIGHTGIVLI